MYCIDLINYAHDMANKYPELRDEILDILDLAKSEIEEGGSADHECQLAEQSINDLIESHKK